MTSGSIWKSLLFFALPIMFGSLLQQLYNTVDGIVVGNYVSQNALAAVGGVASVTFLLLCISNGMSGGASVIVAQYYGAGKMDEMRRAVSTIFIMLGGLGVFFTVFGFFIAPAMVHGILRVEDAEIAEMSILYFKVYACGLLIQYIYNAIAGILRALGDSKSTLYFLCIAAVMNIILDLLFVLKFSWGVFGVAFATVLSQLFCMAFSVFYMLKKYPMFRFKKGEFIFDREIFRITLRLGIPATIQQAIISLGNVLLQRLVNGFGAITMTAFAVGHRVESYCMLPMFAFNTAVSVFAGQNMGAGKVSRAKKGLGSTILLSVISSGVMGVLLYIFAKPFCTLFGVEGAALSQAVEMVRFMAVVITIFAAYFPCSGFLQGSGDALVASVASFTTLGVRVLTAYSCVFFFSVGYKSAWVTMPVGWICAAAVAYSRFFRGKWQKKALVKYDEDQTEKIAE